MDVVGAKGSPAKAGLPFLIPVSVLVAYWPVLKWYVERISDGSDEPFGILALIVGLVIAWRGARSGMVGKVRAVCREKAVCFNAEDAKDTEVENNFPHSVSFASSALKINAKTKYDLNHSTLLLPTLLSLTYLLLGYKLPMLAQGVFLSLTLSILLSNGYLNKKLSLSLLGLLLLSLPLIASLQFFAGFPLRFVTTKLTAHILSTVGIPVGSEGTLLMWRGELVSIDAPCSGVKMLWSGLFLHFTLSGFRSLNNTATAVGYSLSMAAICFGNLTRSVMLFFTESGMIAAPAWVHPAIGLICFTLVSLLIVTAHYKLRLLRSETL